MFGRYAIYVKTWWLSQVWVNVGPETRLATVLDIRPRHNAETIYQLDLKHGDGYWWNECEIYLTEADAVEANKNE